MPPRARRSGTSGSSASTGRAAGRTGTNRRSTPAAKPTAKRQDVTEYATKPATGYQKAMAKWAVSEIGYDPNDAPSKRAAFLKGIQIATAARPAFMESDFLAEYRETSGEAKRGPKPGGRRTAAEKPVRGRSQAQDEDDFDGAEVDDDFDDEAVDELGDDDDDFDEDEDDDGDDGDDDFEDEPEEEPAPRRRSSGNARAATNRSTRSPGSASRGSASRSGSKPTGRSSAKKSADDDFDDLF